MNIPPIPDVGTRLSILGRSGCGKSVLGRSMAIRLIKEGRYVIIWDPDHDYDGIGAKMPRIWNKWTIERTWKKYKCLRINPPPVGDHQAMLEEIVEKLWPVGNFTLIVDEAHEVFPQSGAMANHFPWLKALSKRGRKYGITFIALTQEMALMDKTVIRQSNKVYVMNGLLDLEKEYLKRLLFTVDNLKTGEENQDFHTVDVTGNTVYDPVPHKPRRG